MWLEQLVDYDADSFEECLLLVAVYLYVSHINIPDVES